MQCQDCLVLAEVALGDLPDFPFPFGALAACINNTGKLNAPTRLQLLHPQTHSSPWDRP